LREILQGKGPLWLRPCDALAFFLSALNGFKAWIAFANNVDAAVAAHHFAIFMARLCRAQ